MSLILEALKKLDRDRQAPERGFLVLAPPSWSARSSGPWLRGAGLALVAALGAASAVAFLRSREPRAAAAPSSPRAGAVGAENPSAGTALARRSAPAVMAPATARDAPLALPLGARAAPFPRSPQRTRHGEGVAPRDGRPGPLPAERTQGAEGRAQEPDAAAENPAPPDTNEPPAPAEATEAAASGATIGAGLKLEAISAQEGVPVAVMNGRLVRAGDTIDGVRIVRIGAAEVEIEAGNRRRVLRF